jgi:hypothetical protein
MRGGLVVVRRRGRAVAIAGKGGTLVIGGSTGYMSVHEPAQRLVVAATPGPGSGDSMHEGELSAGPHRRAGPTRSASHPAEELGRLADPCGGHGPPAGEWQKVRAAGKLWR